ncbi:tetratricopeptide repeat protein [bacterium]|nr:tetratricopeptide repeat protein [bacterium]
MKIAVQDVFVPLCLVVYLMGSTGCSSNQKPSLDEALGDIRSVQAKQGAAIDQLNAELRVIRGKLEEVEYAATGKTKELESRLAEFGSRVPPPAGVPGELLVQDEEAISKITGPAADQFKQGLMAVRNGNFPAAEEIMSGFATANPDTAFTDNALFWVGVSRDLRNNFDGAILAYGDAYKRFPAEDRAAVALYYLGDSFIKSGLKDEGIATFERLTEDYASSEYGEKAAVRLRELGKLAPKQVSKKR